MLLAAAGMLGGDVDDETFASEKPAAAGVEFERFEQVGAFVDVEPPGGGAGGKAGGGGFVVF